MTICEGYTTKKCLVCNTHAVVGAAAVFKCKRCGFTCHRDIKARQGYES